MSGKRVPEQRVLNANAEGFSNQKAGYFVTKGGVEHYPAHGIDTGMRRYQNGDEFVSLKLIVPEGVLYVDLTPDGADFIAEGLTSVGALIRANLADDVNARLQDIQRKGGKPHE